MDAKANNDPYILSEQRKFLTWRPLFLAYANTLKAGTHILGTAGALPADNAANRQARKDWAKGHEQAVLLLIKCLPHHQYILNRATQAIPDPVNGPTSAERWTALVLHCVNVDSTYTNTLREKLDSIAHVAKEQVDITIAKLANVIAECRESGEATLAYSDHDIAMRLLRIVGRNSDWSAIAETITASETAAAPLTLNGVEIRLKGLQAQRNDRKTAHKSDSIAGAGGDSTVVHALMVKIESLEKQIGNRDRTRDDGGWRCFNCNATGHNSKNCKQPCGRKLTDGTKCGAAEHTSGSCTNPKRLSRK